MKPTLIFIKIFSCNSFSCQLITPYETKIGIIIIKSAPACMSVGAIMLLVYCIANPHINPSTNTIPENSRTFGE